LAIEINKMRKLWILLLLEGLKLLHLSLATGSVKMTFIQEISLPGRSQWFWG